MGHGGSEATEVAEMVVRRVLGHHWKRFGLGKGLDLARNGHLAHKELMGLCALHSLPKLLARVRWGVSQNCPSLETRKPSFEPITLMSQKLAV